MSCTPAPEGQDCPVDTIDRSCYLQLVTGTTISTRERIRDRGLAVMSQFGLDGVTFSVLADQAGMPKSDLFAHFRSEEEVRAALLEHSAEVASAHVIAPSMSAPEGLLRLKALIGNWFGWTK